MARRLVIFPVLLIFATTATAQTLDKEKLRKAAYLPFMGFGIGVDISGIDKDGRAVDSTRTISKLLKRLKGNLDDGEILLDLASEYKNASKHDEAKKALADFEKLAQPHLKTDDPKLGHLLAWYARYLDRWVPHRQTEAEHFARRAVQIAPNDSRCWESLAWRVAQPAFVSLDNEAAESNDGSQFTAKLDELSRDPRLMQIPWNQVKRRLDEAHACLRKARALAPDDNDVLDSYLTFRLWEHPCRVLMEQLRGEVNLPRNAAALPEIIEIQLNL